MEELEVKVNDRKVVAISRKSAKEAEESGKGNEGIFCGAALELIDGRIITGKIRNLCMHHQALSLTR